MLLQRLVVVEQNGSLTPTLPPRVLCTHTMLKEQFLSEILILAKPRKIFVTLPVKIVNLAQKLKWTIFQVLLDKIGPSTHCVYNRKCSKRLIPAYAFGETSIFSAMIPNQETKTFAAISLESSNLSLLLFDDIKNLANSLIFFMRKKIGSTCHE